VAGHHHLPEVALRQIGVVRAAGESDVLGTSVAAKGKRPVMVKLEAARLGAALPLLVQERALAAVPRVHGAFHGSRDVAGAGSGVALRDRRSRSGGRGLSPGFEPLELLRHGCFNDCRQIGFHEGLESLQLLAKLPARGELHLEPGRSERLHDDRWRCCPDGRFNFNCVRTQFDSGCFERNRWFGRGQGADYCGHVGPRRQLGDHLLDLALGVVHGTSQNGLVVHLGDLWL
jgi:hypothetical protein